jgi:hypothetical protein
MSAAKKLLLCLFLFLCSYVAVGSWYFGSHTLPTLRSGLTHLTLAEQSNPEQAKLYYQQAEAELSTTLSQVANSPRIFWALSPLPPFRWYVQLVKAMHALAVTGLTATDISEHIPPFTSAETTDLSQAAHFASKQLQQFQSEQQPQILLVQTGLQTAAGELQSVPNWILGSNRAQLTKLKQRVAMHEQRITAYRARLDAWSDLCGKPTDTTRTLRVLVGKAQTTVAVTCASGLVEDVSFQQGEKTLDHTTATVRVDASVLAALVGSQTLSLTQAGQTISSVSKPEHLASVAVLPELLVLLIAGNEQQSFQQSLAILQAQAQQGKITLEGDADGVFKQFLQPEL